MKKKIEYLFERFIFASRWIQLPIYVGLVAASCGYVYRFFMVLGHMVSHLSDASDREITMMVLELIDFSMILNLLLVVIVGGYSMFVSRINFKDHEDKPSWLSHMTPNILKVKLIISLVSISGINLLQSFMQVESLTTEKVVLQIAIHITFIVSVLLIAWSDRLIQHE